MSDKFAVGQKVLVRGAVAGVDSLYLILKTKLNGNFVVCHDDVEADETPAPLKVGDRVALKERAKFGSVIAARPNLSGDMRYLVDWDDNEWGMCAIADLYRL